MNYPVSLSLKTGVLASVLALAAGGALAQTTVNAVMHSDLRVLDPVITTAHITRDHAYMIYHYSCTFLRRCACLAAA